MHSGAAKAIDQLNDVIAMARSGGYQTVVALLQMATLELQLQAASIDDEEFRQFVSELQKRKITTARNGFRRGKFAKTTS